MFGAAIGFFAFWVFLSLFKVIRNQVHDELIPKDWIISLVFAIIIGVFSQWGLYLVVQSAIKSVVK